MKTRTPEVLERLAKRLTEFLGDGYALQIDTALRENEDDVKLAAKLEEAASTDACLEVFKETRDGSLIEASAWQKAVRHASLGEAEILFLVAHQQSEKERACILAIAELLEKETEQPPA